jgi:hypothetical protein
LLLNVFVNDFTDISWSAPNSDSGMLSTLAGTDFPSTSGTTFGSIAKLIQQVVKN